MLQDVKVHHILPRPDGSPQDGMFYLNPETGRGMLYIFRPNSWDDRQTIHFKGLDRAKHYWIWSEEGLLHRSRKLGSDLMTNGLPITLGPSLFIGPGLCAGGVRRRTAGGE